jgi:hypothetical protein
VKLTKRAKKLVALAEVDFTLVTNVFMLALALLNDRQRFDRGQMYTMMNYPGVVDWVHNNLIDISDTGEALGVVQVSCFLQEIRLRPEIRRDMMEDETIVAFEEGVRMVGEDGVKITFTEESVTVVHAGGTVDGDEFRYTSEVDNFDTLEFDTYLDAIGLKKIDNEKYNEKFNELWEAAEALS